MQVIENIEQRRSVRTYSGEPLSPELTAQIRGFIAGLAAPLGNTARIELVKTDLGTEKVKLGTYGVISGAKEFLVLLYEDGPLAAEGAGYMFEQVVLFCTELGLGTCWLGGTLKKSDFAAQVGVKDSEQFRIVSPVGYPAGKTRLLDRIMRKGIGSDSRKPFDKMFFNGNFDTPLPEGGAGIYIEPLRMMRLAPSASNTQPWRAVVVKEGVHFFYRDASRFSDIDAGIGLCHFGETCRELGIKGGFEVTDSGRELQTESETYVISWVG